MKKHKLFYRWTALSLSNQTFLSMKLIIVLTLMCSINCIASVHSQVISFYGKNVQMSDFFKSIKKQINYDVISKSSDISNMRLDIDIKNKNLNEALTQVLSKHNLEFVLDNKAVIVKKSDNGHLKSLGKPSSSQIDKTIQNTIEGKVVDKLGKGIPGATITISSKSISLQSGQNGEFTIKAAISDNITVSSIGYESAVHQVKNLSPMTIVLQDELTTVDEVVVVGYGTQKKGNLTGAVSSVKFDEVANTPVANTTNMLQGRLPGVVLTNNGAQAGKDNPEIRIRGIGTLSDNNNPMVLIDGVESDISQISDIAPHDISSISVLKDAASASIYGVRAANGVILVNTKRGLAQPTKISYAGIFAAQTPSVVTEYLNSKDWALAFNDAKGASVYTDEMLQKLQDGSDPDHFANTNWLKEMFKTAPMHQHHLSVNGGNDVSKIMISAQYQDQDGIMLNTGNKRYGFRSNVDSKLGRVNIGLNLSGSKQDIEEPTTSVTGDGLMRMINWFTRPTVPVKYSNGHYGYLDGTSLSHTIFKNPVEMLGIGNKDFENTRFDGKIFASINLFEGLTFESSLGYKVFRQDVSTFSPTRSIYNASGEVVQHISTNSLNDYYYKSTTILNENILKYIKSIQNHQIEVMVAQSSQFARTDLGTASIQNFPTDNIYELDGGTLNPAVTGSAYESALQSFFGRINYNYDSKYLLEVNLRHDGSSRMPKKHRYGTFPSFSAGWNIDRESFMSSVGFVSALKLRASWGQLGNQEIGNYAFSQALQVGGNYYFGDGLSTGLNKVNLANDNITWETTEMTNLGLDFGILNNKLSFSFDWFNKQTSDILLRLSMAPSFLGNLAAPYQNAGKVENKGWEFSTIYSDMKADLKWNVGINLSAVKNKIVDNRGIDNYGNNTINREGNPINSYYGLVSLGLYRTKEDLERFTLVEGVEKKITQFGNQPQLGDIMYADINKDGNISDSDRQIIGNPFPELEYGFNLGLQYKNVGLSMFWQGLAGLDRFNWEQTTLSNGGNLTHRWLDRYSATNTNGSMPHLGANINDRYSSFWLTKGDYLRLKNLELGYEFDSELLKKIGVSSLRAFLAGANLLTFSSVKDFDPEKTSGDLRNDVHPNVKTYSFGINLKF